MTEFENMDEPGDSLDPELWQRLQNWRQSGYEAGRERAERDHENLKSAKRNRQMDRARDATFFWVLPIFILCMVYLESAFGWNFETDTLKMIMSSSVVILIFHLTLRAVIGKD
jgi:hypothetical protein